MDAARHLAHSLKGVAASLEISGVREIAAQIEAATDSPSAAGQGDDGLDLLLDRLALALLPAIQAARSLDDDSDPAAIAPAPAAGEPEPIARPEAVLSACAELRPLVQRQSLSAQAGFATLAGALGLDAQARAAHPLNQALQAWDYALALQHLDRIEDQARPRDAAA